MSKLVRLGSLIHQVSKKNKKLLEIDLLGVSIEKKFMPSVANVIGTDLSKYKVISKKQFACNMMHIGRDKILPIALYKEDKESLISPAFCIFEVNNEKEILPEYLNLIFKQKEFDDYLWFKSDSSVRGSVSWDELCSFEFLLPELEIQKKIIAYREKIEQKLQTNNKRIDNLYRMSDMYYNVLIKEKGNKLIKLSDIATFDNGYSYSGEELQSSNVGLLSIKNISREKQFRFDGFKTIKPIKKVSDNKVAKSGDVLVSHTDITPSADIIGVPILVPETEFEYNIFSMDLVRVRPLKYNNFFIFGIIHNIDFKNRALSMKNGTTVFHLDKMALPNYEFLIPEEDAKIEEYSDLNKKIFETIWCLEKENNLLNSIMDKFASDLIHGYIKVGGDL